MVSPNPEILVDLGSSLASWAVFHDGMMVVIPAVPGRGKMQPIQYCHPGEVGTSEVPPVQSHIGLGSDGVYDILSG